MGIRELHYEDVAAVAYAKDNQSRSFGTSQQLFGYYETATSEISGLMVSDWKWDLAENISVNCGELRNLVFFSLTEAGSVYTEMGGLGKLDRDRTDRGGLYYWSEGCQHQLKKDTTVTGLSIAIDVSYFAEMISVEGDWGEIVARKIEKGEPFWFGGHQLASLPLVQQQTRLIRERKLHGMGSLHMQSVVSGFLYSQLESIRNTNSKYNADNTVNKDDADKLYALRYYLEQHFLDDFNLRQLVRISNLNEFKLKRGFRILFGTSVFQFISGLRMQYAGNLLRNHKFSITETAWAVGYQYPQHFATAFKKYFGVTPSAWIK